MGFFQPGFHAFFSKVFMCFFQQGFYAVLCVFCMVFMRFFQQGFYAFFLQGFRDEPCISDSYNGKWLAWINAWMGTEYAACSLGESWW